VTVGSSGGLITRASDEDPSGIGTYSQADAQLGFGIGWTMLLTYSLMVAIQEISGRIGRITGCGIAGNVRRNFRHSFYLGLGASCSSPTRQTSRRTLEPWRTR
jgi:Mn2+/Fe2+ NRAMP family transporter